MTSTRAGGRICVVGSFMMDIVVNTPVRPAEGETVLGQSVAFHLGGKGFNQVIASARSGGTASMIGRVGDDEFGLQFRRCLRHEGVDVSGVTRDPNEGTGIGVPIVDAKGSNAIVVVPRANFGMTVDQVEAMARHIAHADVLLVQLEIPTEATLRALMIARDAQVTTILNPAPAPTAAQLNAFRGLVDIIIPNESEAAAIAAIHTAEPVEVAAAVADRVASHSVLLTLGPGGALLWNNGRATRIPGHPVAAIDTVGAGDAVCGAFAAALATGRSQTDAAAMGNAAGALAVTVPGAEPSMPRLDAIVALLGQDPSPPSSTPAIGRYP